MHQTFHRRTNRDDQEIEIPMGAQTIQMTTPSLFKKTGTAVKNESLSRHQQKM